MGRIPEATVEQVLASTDIVELVGRYVKLRRAGTNFVGLCPFHNEKTPSFNVSPSRNSYHCFGCGAGGTALGFLMDHDGMTFVEAVKRLADAAGIRIEEEVWDANAERDAKIRASLIRAHQRLAEWYHHLLMKDPVADVARQYLKSRGINAQVAKRWQLGFAPGAGDLMRRWSREQDISEGLLIDAGILAKGERGETYPRFRQRLMFPICNDNGEVIAFSGRLLDADAKAAKYLNSPETPIFSKSRNLFGFHKARRAVAKKGQAIICEGQVDLVMAYEAGFENVVAALGTAFTEHHAKLLKRHADEVVMCFDSDAAGYKAAEKSFRILSPSGLVIKIAVMPSGDDPDTLIRREGPRVFQQIIDQSTDFVDYQIMCARSMVDFTDHRATLRYADKVAENIRLIPDVGLRKKIVVSTARTLGLAESDLENKVERMVRAGKAGQDIVQETDRTKEAKALVEALDPAAKMLALLALNNAEIMKWLRATGKSSLLRDIPGTELLSAIWDSDYNPEDQISFNVFHSLMDPVYGQALSNLLAKSPPPGGLPEADQALKALELGRIQHQIRRIQTQLKAPGVSPEEQAALQREMLDWRKEYLDRRAASLDTPRLPS